MTKEKSKVQEYVEAIVIAILIAFFIRTFVVQAFKIPSGSMKPTLLGGDHILVNKFIYGVKMPYLWNTILPFRDPKRGDIIVFIYPEDRSKDFIKRVVGVPGDTLEIRDKRIFLNGLPFNDGHGVYTDPLIIPGALQPRDNFGPITVPRESLFVMGDNRDESYDSRFWGCLPVSAVRGRPWVLFFSYRAESDVHLKTGVRDKLRRWTQYVPRARWDRILHVVH
jgi:signal peptidase I